MEETFKVGEIVDFNCYGDSIVDGRIMEVAEPRWFSERKYAVQYGIDAFGVATSHAFEWVTKSRVFKKSNASGSEATAPKTL